MKKSEMEWHFNSLRESSTTIGLMLRQRPIDLSVFDRCVETFEHIAPALQYWAKERPNSDPFSVVPYRAIELVGPAFFAHDAIEAMCKHVNSTRYLKKVEFPFAGVIEGIHARKREAVALWSWIEHNAGGEQRFLWQEADVDRASGISTLDQWVDCGIVVRTPIANTYTLVFASDLSAPVTCMCPNCGISRKAPRGLVYKHRACQGCGADVFYHLVQTTEG